MAFSVKDVTWSGTLRHNTFSILGRAKIKQMKSIILASSSVLLFVWVTHMEWYTKIATNIYHTVVVTDVDWTAINTDHNQMCCKWVQWHLRRIPRLRNLKLSKVPDDQSIGQRSTCQGITAKRWMRAAILETLTGKFPVPCIYTHMQQRREVWIYLVCTISDCDSEHIINHQVALHCCCCSCLNNVFSYSHYTICLKCESFIHEVVQ